MSENLRNDYALYIEKSPDGIFISDETGKYMAVNPAACALLGYSEAELLQRSISEITPPSDLKHFQSLWRDGESKGDVPLIRKDGSVIMVNIHAVALGRNRFMGLVRDISERKRFEERLQCEVEINAALAELAVALMASKNRNDIANQVLAQAQALTKSKFGYVGYINPENGYLICNRCSKNVWDYCTIENKYFVFHEFKGLWGWVLNHRKPLFANTSVEHPFSVGTPPGHIELEKFLAVPILINGQIAGLIALANSEVDYTEEHVKVVERVAAIYALALQRIYVEETLKKSEEYYSLILNGISEVIVLLQVVNEDKYRIVQFNNQFAKLMQLRAEQLQGKLVHEIAPANIAELWLQRNLEVIRTGLAVQVEQELDGYGIFEVKLEPIIDEAGKCTHIIIVARDIENSKKLEEHLLKAEKLESLGLLAGGIAHDFNNILTVIIGNNALAKIKANKFSDEIKGQFLEPLTEIDKAYLQAKDLTQQLLTFAKGGSPILKVVSVPEFIRESAEFALKGSSVRCSYKFSENLCPVEIDKGQINQVLNNLILNAIHAMPRGGQISIKAQNIMVDEGCFLPLKSGDYLEIAIQDSGIGIQPEHLPKLFDPFFSTKPMGTGLGLTTTYSIVKKHCGWIAVESELGVGTTFTIYLPASQKKLAKTADNPEMLIVDKGKVLVLDDDNMLREVIVEMLTSLHYQADSVADGVEAIALYKNAQLNGVGYDAVILDLTIPAGMGGVTVVKELREFNPMLKAIVSSGYYHDPVLANYQEYGFQAMLKKPYTIDNLDEVLQRVINSSG